MQNKKFFGRMILRVLTSYKKTMLLGLFLGISLALGTILVGKVVGDEKKPITYSIEHQVHIEQAEVQAQEQTSVGEDESGKRSDESVLMPEYLDIYYEPVSNFKNERFTVLLVGVDSRPGDRTFSNTDTLLVVSVDTVNGRIALLSIPRDTQITMPGHGKEKINAAARVGKGIKTTIALIEDLIGQTIDGYVITNFNGFKSIIDTLGGITINVEKDMQYVTGDATDGVINLKKGIQRLNGEQALQYARFRHDALADISRTARQQAIIRAIGKEFMQIKTVSKLPWLIPQIAKSVDTNLSIAQLWTMSNFLLHIKNPEISSQTLPGKFLVENDISYWKVNPEKSRVIVKRLFEEGKSSSTFGI
ncbi:MAG: LCP family protein [Desulfosporosinus sp.]|jgi:LCP family protein required for cell wall assembly